MKNLRKHPDGYYYPALPPAEQSLPEGWRPLTIINVNSSDRLLITDGSSVGFLEGAFVVGRCALSAAVVSAVEVDGRVVVITSEGVHLLEVAPDTLRLSVLPQLSSVLPSVRSVDRGYVYASVESVKVNAADAARGILSAAERRALAAAAREAMAEIDREVEAGDTRRHPVFARVRCCDAAGNVLFFTEPVLLTHPEGREFDGRIVFRATTEADRVAADDLEVAVWEPRLDVPEALSAILPAGAVLSVVESGADTFYLGATPAVSGRRRAGDALATVTLVRRAFEVPAFEAASPGVVCGAADVAVGPSSVIWAAPSIRRPDPADALRLAATLDAASGPWQAAVAVKFADGSVQVTPSDGAAGAPATFSPLISVGRPDAVELTVIVNDSAGVRRDSFALTSRPSEGRAVYVHPSHRPFALSHTTDKFEIPAASPRILSYPRLLAAASTQAPLDVALTVASPATVNAVALNPTGQSAWDFGRDRFYVFCKGGIFSLRYDAGRRAASMALIDSRVTLGPQAVCPVDGSVAAIASGDVLLLAGNRIKTVGTCPAATALAWNHADHELWAFEPAQITVFCFDDDYSAYEMPAVDVAWLCRAAFGQTYLTSVQGVTLLVGHTGLAGSVDVEMSAETVIGASPAMRECLLRLHAPGDYDALKVTVAETDGRLSAPRPLYEITLRGTLKSPLVRKFPVPALTRRLRTTLRADATPSSRLFSLKITPNS